MKSNAWVAIIVVGVFVAGIFLGKRYAPQPVVKETITVTKWEPWPYPVEVEVEKEKLVPVVTEPPAPEIIVKYETVDTAAIVADYLLKRKYDLDFSQDSLGTFIAHVDVQGNAVVRATSTIQPLMRTNEVTRVVQAAPRFIGGYAMIGSSLDFQTAKVSAGVEFRERYTVGASGIKMNNDWGYTIDFGIKF